METMPKHLERRQQLFDVWSQTLQLDIILLDLWAIGNQFSMDDGFVISMFHCFRLTACQRPLDLASDEKCAVTFEKFCGVFLEDCCDSRIPQFLSAASVSFALINKTISRFDWLDRQLSRESKKIFLQFNCKELPLLFGNMQFDCELLCRRVIQGFNSLSAVS